MTETEIFRTGQPTINFVGEEIAGAGGAYYVVEIYRTDDHGYATAIDYHDAITERRLYWASLFRNADSARRWLNEHRPGDYANTNAQDEYIDLVATLLQEWDEAEPERMPRRRNKVKT